VTDQPDPTRAMDDSGPRPAPPPPPTSPYAAPPVPPAGYPSAAPTQPPVGPYGAPPGYAAAYAPMAAPPMMYGTPHPAIASWGQRVGASLIDALYALPGVVMYLVGLGLAATNAPTTSRSGMVVTSGNPGLATAGFAVFGLGLVYLFVIGVYNTLILQGRTGQTWGKRRVGLRIVRQDNGQILTMGNNFLRYLCHYLDGAVYIGYLWPLWDPMRQTFADKLMKTVVVKER